MSSTANRTAALAAPRVRTWARAGLCLFLAIGLGACASTHVTVGEGLPNPASTLQATQTEATGFTVPSTTVDLSSSLPVAGSRSTWIGAGVGFVVGAVATWAFLYPGGSTAHCDQAKNQDAWSKGQCAGVVVLGGTTGAGLGALISRLWR